MKLALFGSGGALPETALRALASQHEICLLVHPQPRPASGSAQSTLRQTMRPLAVKLGLRRDDAMQQAAKELGIPLLPSVHGQDPAVRDALRKLDLDLIVIAAFPQVLSPEIFSIPQRGAVNLHTSLLPRHRGPFPLFWVYHADDRETGVTVHEVAEKVDAGKILQQCRFDLPRAYPIESLHGRCAKEGARLLVELLEQWEERERDAVVQDELGATSAPRVKAGTAMVKFQEWPAERVWHFLKGMYPHFVEPLRLENGKSIAYMGVGDYEETPHSQTPGSLERVNGSFRLFCQGGTVILHSEKGGAH